MYTRICFKDNHPRLGKGYIFGWVEDNRYRGVWLQNVPTERQQEEIIKDPRGIEKAHVIKFLFLTREEKIKQLETNFKLTKLRGITARYGFKWNLSTMSLAHGRTVEEARNNFELLKEYIKVNDWRAYEITK